jgi:toxin ParE1/3/4
MLISTHPLANQELMDGVDYYLSTASTLVATNFLDEFERSAKLIEQFPNLATKADGNYRRLPLHRYPYKIVYFVTYNAIRIVAVAHDRRAPNYWHDRV